MPVISENISVSGPDGDFSAYLSAPDRPNGVAVIVLQEIFGVNANIRGIADSFAAQGYVAVAPDLYWRQVPKIELDPGSEDGRLRAMELMKGLDRDQAVQDSLDALSAAQARVAGIQRSAAVGYCFGGGVAYLLAVRNNVDAGVAYYGTYLQTVLDEAANLKGKLLLHIAANDHVCPPVVQEAIKAAVAPLGDRATAAVHEGVGHAFARVGGATYDAVTAERANAMTDELLASLIPA